MDRPTHGIDIGDVANAIDSRFRLLRFNPRLERQFETDVAADRCKHMIRQNYIGVIIYHSFLFADYHVVTDAFSTDIIVHLIVITPLMFAANFIIGRQPPVWLREGLQSLNLVILALTIVLVVCRSHMPNRDVLQLSIVLVILFATVMQRLRFWYVVAACLSAQVVYSLGLTTFVPFSMDRTIMANFVFSGILLFSLVAAYNLEHEQRMGYLLRLRDCFRNRELEIMSSRDALTGLGNRRALEAAIGHLDDRSAPRIGRSTAVLLLDIDHFKRFNDTNGHQSGDICLKRVARVVADSLRVGEGEVYRFGGEEFLVLLDGMSLVDAVTVAERLRSSVAHAGIARDAAGQSFVTISVGAAAGSLGHDVTLEHLIAAADHALYTAKHNGRDQVSSALDPQMPPPFVLLAQRLAG